MLRKSPTSNAIKKLQKLSKFQFFSYLKFSSVSIIKKITFIVSVKPNLKT